MHEPEHLTQEPGDPVFICAKGWYRPHQEVQGRTLMMNGYGKSHSPIVPKKPSNKVAHATAEEVEGRGLAKENSRKRTTLRTQSREGVSQALERVRQAAERGKRQQFTALLHHIDNIDNLRESYFALKRDSSTGIDEETWHHYGESLEEHLADLSDRVKRGAYRAQPARRAYIPKPDGRQRPIGVPVLEDKIVQRATAAVLGVIYETAFIGFSYGFRPKRNAHQATDALTVGIERKKVNWVLDADIRGFFDTLNHEWLVKFIEHRVSDRRVIRLIQKWLKAGVLEDEEWTQSEVGTVQGGSISPLLANIYLHYVFDLWVQQWRKKHSRGDVIVVRFADDFVVGFQHRREAERFLTELRERFAQFGLSLHAEKTRLIEFGRFAAENRSTRGEGKPETFAFLGLTHICGKTRKGKFTVTRKTMRSRMLTKLKEIAIRLRKKMHQPVPEQGQYLAAVIRGHMQYYGVPGNSRSLTTFRWEIGRLWRKTLCRRSQNGYVRWDRMNRLISRWLPKVYICHDYPSVRFVGII